MREDEISQTETLKMNHLSVEEVAARRAELAKMRDLMFRAEAKAKRLAKIKSKTYRRLRKKERVRLAEKLGEGEDDLDDDGADAEADEEYVRGQVRHVSRCTLVLVLALVFIRGPTHASFAPPCHRGC